MVVDDQLRPLFAFLRAIPVPTSLYAAPEDWGSSELGKRITRAATELALLLRSGAPRDIADDNWQAYQHQFNGNATRAQRSTADIDFTTDLMRLAAGGRSPKAAPGDLDVEAAGVNPKSAVTPGLSLPRDGFRAYRSEWNQNGDVRQFAISSAIQAPLRVLG